MDESYSHYVTLDDINSSTIPPTSLVADLLNPSIPRWTPTSLLAHSNPAELYLTPSFLVNDIGSSFHVNNIGN